jgi:thiol-disulfide isomerase/thioredoxin
MTGRWRRPLVIAVVLVATVLAVRPWTWHSAGSATPAAPVTTTANYSAERAAAALPACRSGTRNGARFAGVRVTCLADGADVDFAGLVADTPVLVNTWATWCQPCQQELPALDAYARQPGAIRVLGVQVRDDQGDPLALLRTLGVHLPMVSDHSGAAAKALGLVVGLPASYLVRPDGSVTLISQPRVFDDPNQVRATVEAMLGSGRG